ncbi:MAG: glycine cleavage system protein H [Deltaproteobacteria bacterium]|nr:glycine cleavage system protein H [Deltaproteobacteria bacterium]
MPHDFLASHSIKLVEYGIALSFLLLFVPFWSFVNGGKAAQARVPVLRPHAVDEPVLGFVLPEALLFHPGHAWARLEGATATVGLSDFAQRLVGAIESIRVPAVGEKLGQGEKAWSLHIGGQSVDMLSPLDGRVVAVNEKVLADPALLKADPYGEGWLLKVDAARPAANAKHLLSFRAARRHLEEAWAELRARLSSSELGPVMQDGGAPVDGLAQGIDQARWHEIVRQHFLT